MDRKQHFIDCLIKENPLLTLFLGIGPAVAVTTKASLALRFGLVSFIVLLASNVIVSGLKRIIPDQVRIPCYVLISAAITLFTESILRAFLPSFGDALYNFIPMLAISSLILGRAEMFAGKRTIEDSAVDALGTGLGYLIVLVLAGAIRELAGKGTIFGLHAAIPGFIPLVIFTLAPGGLLILGLLAALFKKLSSKLSSNENAGGSAE